MNNRRNTSGRRSEDQDYLMTDGEVARLAKVSPNTVRYWRQTGLIPFVKVGRHPRVWRSALMETFHKPSTSLLFETKKVFVKMPRGEDVGRKQ